jgi:hypothetical protein
MFFEICCLLGNYTASCGNYYWLVVTSHVSPPRCAVQFLCLGFLSSWNLDPLGWDRYVVPKRR